MMGHHLRVNGFGAQPSCITPVDGGRDIGQLQPDPQRRFLTAKQRIETTAKIGRLAGKPGIELIVQGQNCVVPGTQAGQGGNHLPVGTPDELAACGPDLGKELRNRRSEDQGVGASPGVS